MCVNIIRIYHVCVNVRINKIHLYVQLICVNLISQGPRNKTEVPKTIQEISTVFGYPPELVDKILLPKTFGLFLMVSSACLIVLRTSSQRVALPIVSRVFLYQSSIKKMYPGFVHRPILWGYFLKWSSLFQNYSFFWVDIKLASIACVLTFRKDTKFQAKRVYSEIVSL